MEKEMIKIYRPIYKRTVFQDGKIENESKWLCCGVKRDYEDLATARREMDNIKKNLGRNSFEIGNSGLGVEIEMPKGRTEIYEFKMKTRLVEKEWGELEYDNQRYEYKY